MPSPSLRPQGHRTRALLALPALLPLIALPSQAQAPAAPLEAALRERLDATLLRYGPNASVGVRVVQLPGGEVLYERGADLSLNPASNMKLVTSAAALARLGPDYRFTTRVLRTGEVKKGTLRGDLVLQGGGDPVLLQVDLAQLADQVKAAGIRRVRGALLADDYRYDAERLGFAWNWDDEPYYYSAQVSALSVDRNVLRVSVTPAATAGERPTVVVKPMPGYVELQNEATTGAKESPANVDVGRVRGRNIVQVRGTVPVGGAAVEEPVTMEEPELWATTLFRHLLKERGVDVEREPRRAPAPADAAEVAKHDSPPLSEIVALFNKPSDNLIGELLLKELGYRASKQGTTAAGGRDTLALLREWGVDVRGLSLKDGSGLSRTDYLTAHALTDLLVRTERQPWAATYRASLPVAGVDGTLRRRLKGTKAERNLLAKTGSLMYVSSLSGYVTTADGRRLAFSLISNSYTGTESAKAIEDRFAVALAEAGAP